MKTLRQQPSPRLNHGTRQIRVVGLGNPLLGDDGFGWQVAQKVQRALVDQPIESQTQNAHLAISVDCLAVGGLRLMEHLAGCHMAILIDAITTGQHPVGHLYHGTLDDLPHLSAGHMSSAHDTTLQTALKMGREMGVSLPDPIWVIGVEIEPVFEFSDTLSPLVRTAVWCAMEIVLEKLHQEVQ